MQESYTASGKPINGPPPVHSPAVWVDDDHLSRHFAPEPFFSSKRFVSMRSRISLAGSLLALLSASGVLAQESGDGDKDFRISNFVSGPVCRDPDLVDERRRQGQPPSDRICAGTDVPIRGEDGCIWSGEHRRCTWYGIEFDYENADPSEPIVCVWTRSRPGMEGNAEGVRSEGLATDTVEVELEGERGHYFSPGYDLYTRVSVPWAVVRLSYDCTYRGEPAYEASFRIIYSSAFD